MQVFSNKTESDQLCLRVHGQLVARGLKVWQQKTNIPKDSDNWFQEWYPSAISSRKIVCFLTADYLKSKYCMKEFNVAESRGTLLVVACEPLAEISAVDPAAFPHASNALAYLMIGGQVIFHDTDDVVAEFAGVRRKRTFRLGGREGFCERRIRGRRVDVRGRRGEKRAAATSSGSWDACARVDEHRCVGSRNSGLMTLMAALMAVCFVNTVLV